MTQRYQASNLTDVLYLREPGDTTAISVNDIHQGNLGDCFLLSSIGELALNDPSAIRNMIQANGNGTETVTLYQSAKGTTPGFHTTQFQPVQVTVTNKFPGNAVNGGAKQDVVGNKKEIWVQVLEKAYAKINGGYAGINQGGYPPIAMEELTGQHASLLSSHNVSFSQLESYVSAGDLITMDTPSRGGLPFNLVSDHAYMFEGITMDGGTPMVKLGNPWGFHQPELIPFASLTQGISEIDVGRI